MVERHRHIEELVHAVLKLEPSQRESFLSSACASDPSLRSEIEALVSAHEREGSFQNLPAYEVAPGVIEIGGGALIGRVIGHYEVIDLIWGDQYRRKAADIFAIEEDIAREISEKLRVKITPEKKELWPGVTRKM